MEIRTRMLKTQANLDNRFSLYFDFTVFGVDNTLQSVKDLYTYLHCSDPRDIIIPIAEERYTAYYLPKIYNADFQKKMKSLAESLPFATDDDLKTVRGLTRNDSVRPGRVRGTLLRRSDHLRGAHRQH